MFKEKRIFKKEKKIEPFKTLIENITQKENFNFENSAFILDIDGVLIDVNPKIFLEGLFNFLTSREKFENFLKKYKINFSTLKTILNLSEKGAKVILFSSRFLSKNKNYFPFLSEKIIDAFKKRNIEVVLTPKFLGVKPPQEIIDYIKEKDKVFYIGSSGVDKLMYKKLKKTKENIDYYQLNSNKII
jgi:FMN phosphatase YigB (HAD superfamily)